MSDAAQAPLLAMVSSVIPESRELYVPREIAALRAAGIAVLPASIFRPNHDIIQPEHEALRREAFPCRPWAPSTWLGALAECARRPRAVLGILRDLLVWGCRSPEQLLKTLLLFPAATRLARHGRQHGITWVHAQWANVSSTTGYVAARLMGVPFSFSIHGEPIFNKRPCGLLALKCRDAAFAVSCNDAAVRYLLTHGAIASERIHRIHHGVDRARFSPGATKVPNTPFRLVTAGRLERSKGLPILLEAVARLRAAGRPVVLEIIGSGPEEAMLRRQAEERAIADAVTFTPYLAQRELPDRYRAADAFVLTAREAWHWGIPNVLLEAMACGTAAVATELPSMTGFFVPDTHYLPARDGDAADAARQIARLMDEAPLRATLERNGPPFVATHFDWTTNLQAFVERVRTAFAQSAETGDGR